MNQHTNHNKVIAAEVTAVVVASLKRNNSSSMKVSTSLAAAKTVKVAIAVGVNFFPSIHRVV